MISNNSNIEPNLRAALSVVGAGLVGAGMARIGILLARRVLVITKLLDKIIPLPLQEKVVNSAQLIARIASMLKRPLVKDNIMTFKNYSVFVAPVTEEFVYRLILQQGASTILKHLGIPSTIAKTIVVGMIVITNVLFGLAHESDIAKERFVSVFLQGVAFSVAQTFGGLRQPF